MFPSSSQSPGTCCVFPGHVLICCRRNQPGTQAAPENGKKREREVLSFRQSHAAGRASDPSFPSFLFLHLLPLFFSFALPLFYKDSIPSHSMWSTLPPSSNFPSLSSLLVPHHSQTSSVCLSRSLSLPCSLSLLLRCHLRTCVGRRSQWIPEHKSNFFKKSRSIQIYQMNLMWMKLKQLKNMNSKEC